MAKLELRGWQRLVSVGPFADPGEPVVVGVSGGRTSAMMAALSPPSSLLCFQNTGKEHPNTYEFIERLSDALGRPITWLEMRPPLTFGAPPREFRHEVVTARTASRKGEPFEDFMRCLANYRRIAKDANPISPWARQRICTAYMKIRVQDSYVRSLGIESHTRFVGIRHDEPTRWDGLRRADTSTVTNRAPLYDARIDKTRVLEFWSWQTFDLQVDEILGNCTGCFLKDETDLSRALGVAETDANWWIAMESKYDSFGGRKFRGYANLLHELPTRIAIERAIKDELPAADDGRLDPKRYRLVYLQEKRRAANGPTGFACTCEASLIGDE